MQTPIAATPMLTFFLPSVQYSVNCTMENLDVASLIWAAAMDPWPKRCAVEVMT
jgi:hypothetical protein